MADYFEPTVVQPTIPDADMTPLERLLLSRIFHGERVGEGWYFFAPERPADIFSVTRAELDETVASPPDIESTARICITEQLADMDTDASEIEIDLSCVAWELFFQDIAKRSKTLRYVSIINAFTCSKMRPDAFGGTVTLITRNAMICKNTNDILAALITEAGLDSGEEAKTADAAPATPASE